jgi:hypothetical protein
MPTCIDWVDNQGDMYITSHPSDVGTQRLVHNIWAPAMESASVLTRAFEKEYRGHLQTFWKVNVDVLYNQLAKFPRWK